MVKTAPHWQLRRLAGVSASLRLPGAPQSPKRKMGEGPPLAHRLLPGLDELTCGKSHQARKPP